MQEKDWIDIQDNEFKLYEPGTLSAIVDDPKASDGKAARMPATHVQWAVQYPVSSDWAALGPLRCCVVARCEPKAAAGDAFTIGIYDGDNKRDVARKVVTLAEAADGEYHAWDLGVQELTPAMYVWIAPQGNSDAVGAVYVDRIFCRRAPARIER